MNSKLSRRAFLRWSALTAVGTVAAACAQPTAEVIEKEVPVERIVKETVVVEKQVPVEKVVKETVVVEKQVAVEKVVTATPVPVRFHEAPMLADLVKAGKLPPVDERLPEDPLVITPVGEVGQYGGTWHRFSTAPGDNQMGGRNSYEMLLRYDVTGAAQYPNVVKSYEVSADGRVFTFNMRKGMKWSNGDPHTADDYLFMYEDVLLNTDLQPSFPSWLKSGGEPCKVEKVSDYVFRFVFAEPYGLFIPAHGSQLAFMFHPGWPSAYMKQFHANYVDAAKLAAMVKEAGFENWWQIYRNKDDNLGNIDRPVLWAWTTTVPAPKLPMVAERNPYYWKVDTEGNQLPYIDQVEHQVVQGTDAVNLRCSQGEADMQARHLSVLNYPIFQQNKDIGNYRVLLWDNGLSSDAVLALNMTNKDPVLRAIVEDVRFRQALSLGINREEFIEGIYLGLTEPSQVAPIKSSPHYWEPQATNLIEYDTARAGALLDEMGLNKMDGDGYRLRPDGERLTIYFEYTSEFGGSWTSIAELLSAQWKKIGVDLIPKDEARNLYSERMMANELDMGIWNGDGGENPLLDMRWFIPFSSGSQGMYEYVKWWTTGGKEGEEPKGDIRKALDLYEEIKVTIDQAEQRKLFRQILELNMNNLWTIGICTAPPQPCIVSNRMHNVPEKALWSPGVRSPGNTMTEQYYLSS